jgi:hypothetical protein
VSSRKYNLPAAAGPGPIPRGTHQPALHRVIVHVIQFLPPLFFSVNVQGMKAAVPKAEVGLIMDLSVSLSFGWSAEIQRIHRFSPRGAT